MFQFHKVTSSIKKLCRFSLKNETFLFNFFLTNIKYVFIVIILDDSTGVNFTLFDINEIMVMLEFLVSDPFEITFSIGSKIHFQFWNYLNYIYGS